MCSVMLNLSGVLLMDAKICLRTQSNSMSENELVGKAGKQYPQEQQREGPHELFICG